MTERLPCGCKHDGHKWLEMCAPCRAEHDARHAQAAEDHRRAEAARTARSML